MQVAAQLEFLKNSGSFTPFIDKVRDLKKYPVQADDLEILQLNISRKCNLQCKHCHVQAGPQHNEIMTKKVLQKCLDVLEKNPSFQVIDITGGAPETNPHLEWFLSKAVALQKRLIVRTNLVILKDPDYSKYMDIYTDNQVEIVSSLPSFHEKKTQRQRGDGTFAKTIEVLQELNQRGYGHKAGFELNLVHNPVGFFLPGKQQSLERSYKKHLQEKYNIQFNNLFCLVNIPLGRYLEQLTERSLHEEYLQELATAFNPHALEGVMCKKTLSVGYDGTIYDCDFNQVLKLPVNHGAPDSIFAFEASKLKHRQIKIDNHCYACTAGNGSTCQGSSVEA